MNPLLLQPVPTGDAAARYERLSHSGSTWYDLMPTPANGTDNGWVAPPLWPVFDGAQTVVVGQPAKLALTGDLSFVAWASQDVGVTGFERVMNRDPGAGNRLILSLHDITGVPFFGIGVSGTMRSVQGPGPTNDGEWHMVVGTYDGATVALYIDGALSASAAFAGVGDISGATDLDFGSQAAAGSFLEGRIDTCRIYPRALSPDEILRDYHAGKPAHP